MVLCGFWDLHSVGYVFKVASTLGLSWVCCNIACRISDSSASSGLEVGVLKQTTAYCTTPYYYITLVVIVLCHV